MDRHWGERELGLQPPLALLSWLAPAAPEVVPQVWQQAVRDALAEKALAGRFPLRDAERSMIAEGFLGAVIWQHVCQELGGDQAVLLEGV